MVGKGTHCVKDEGDKQIGAINTPLYLSSTFQLNPMSYAAIQNGSGMDANIYTRWGNPTTRAFEQKMALLEHGEAAVAFSSGMAAIASVMLSHLEPDDELVTTRELYGGTFSLIEKELIPLGISVRYTDCTSPEDIAAAITSKTKLLFFESLSNPLLKIINIPEVAAVAQEHKIPLVVDATFASPINQNPLALGADIVVHSASKYLGGHSDLIAGVVVGSHTMCETIWPRMTHYGGCIDPFQSYLLLRSLKTLYVRIQKHNENAQQVAHFLEQHNSVDRVWYPGIPSHPQHKLANNLLSGFGGMVAFRLNGADEDGLHFMCHLDLVKEAASLGGVESLASMPFNTSHSYLNAEERTAIGIDPGTVRLSVGIEDAEDIIADLAQALDAL